MHRRILAGRLASRSPAGPLAQQRGQPSACVPHNSAGLEVPIAALIWGNDSLAGRGRVSRPGRLEGAGPGSGTRGQLVDLAGRFDADPGQQVPGGLGQFGALPECPGGPGESTQVDPAEFAAHHRPGLPGRVLGDADEQQRQPAQQDVGADPFFEPVVDGPQVQDGFHVRSERALRPLLGYLRGIGIVPAAEAAVPETAGEVLLARFAAYLAGERGLAPATVSSYLFQVRPFVAAHADAGRWSSLSAGQIARFAGQSAAGLCPRSAQVRANALRALLGFMWQEGLTASALAGAVGCFAAPAGAAPPRGLSPGQADDLLAAVRAGGPAGVRNEPMVALMLRLALRAGEVAALLLEDIDWRSGVLSVRGKGSRLDEMPLPADVGQPLARYLRHGRPAGTCGAIAPAHGASSGATCFSAPHNVPAAINIEPVGGQRRDDPVHRPAQNMLLICQPRQEPRGEYPLRHRPGRRRRAGRPRPRAGAPPPPPHDPGDLHLPVDLLAVLGAQELKRLPALRAAPCTGIHIDDAFLSLQMRLIPPPVTRPARPLPPLTRAAWPASPLPAVPPRGRAALLRRRAEQQPAQRRHALLQPGHLPGHLSHSRGQPGLIRPQRGGRSLQLRDPRLGPPGAGTPVTGISILIDHRHGKHMIQHTPL